MEENKNTTSEQPNNQQFSGYALNFQDEQKTQGNDKIKSWLIIGSIILLAILVIAGIIFFVYNLRRQAPASSDSTNQQAEQSADQKKGEPVPKQDLSTPELRDEQRLKDVTNIRNALGSYYQDHQAYPDVLEDLVSKYLEILPNNPKPGGENYVYRPQQNNQDYKLSFTLERGAQMDSINLASGRYQATTSGFEPITSEQKATGTEDSKTNERVEIINGLDSDKDGVSDIEENIYHSKSATMDTDQDGYTDGTEITSFYDPAKGQGALLIDSNTVNKYDNKRWGYTVVYPAEWTVKALTEDNQEVIFNSATSEYFQIIIQPNPVSLSARAWYQKFNPTIDNSQLIDLSINGLIGVQTKDGLNTYLTVGSNIYLLIYNLGTTNQLNYKITYQLFLKSFAIRQDFLAEQVRYDEKREQDVTAIHQGLLKYMNSQLSLPSTIDNKTETSQQIGTLVDGCQSSCHELTLENQCVDLSSFLAPMGLTQLPKDPSGGSDAKTGYYLNLQADGSLLVGSCQSTTKLIEVKN